MTSFRLFALLALFVGCVVAIPTEVEKRGEEEEGDIGEGVLVGRKQNLPDPEKRDAEEGDIGQGVIQPKQPQLPDPDDEDRKKRAYYYYYYSETSSEPNVVGPELPDPEDFIDYSEQGGTGRAPGCLPEYAAMDKPHTMCVFEDEPTISEVGLSPEQIDFIVNKHNEYRAQEPAASMVKMYWDDNIAVVAQKLAQSCHKGHDENYNRLVPGYNIPIGQNWCGGVKTWDKCLELWHNEKAQWHYGEKSDLMIQHFTQMVNTKAVAIGCGYAYCPLQHRQNMVCNYAFGQTSKDVMMPYVEGEPCDRCEGFCKDDLCDCGDKVCKNNGKLNQATCQCECIKPFAGENCEEVDCSKKDKKACGKKVYIFENCNKYANLPGLCPRECGLCPRD